jgi:hypothetical protein
MIKLKEILQDAVLDERIVYHGTISDFVDKIKASGKLKSVQAGAQKVSGGFTTEKGLIWVTPNFNIANYYAAGIESNNEYNIEKGLKANYGGVFEIEIDDNLKLIDKYEPLTKEQIDILNSKFIPHYKPLHIGDTLSTAEWRGNGKQIHDMIKALGFDGVVYDKHQIGIVADELPIKVFHHKPYIKLSEYARLLCEKMTVDQANNIFAQYGVTNASALGKEKLKAAWIKLVKQYHTDISSKDPNALKDINAAYDILKLAPISTASTEDYFDKLYKTRYQTQGNISEPWQTDDRAMRDPNPQKPNINYYKKRAWEISGKPESKPNNKYTFWNWDGDYLRGVFSVYTTPEHWYEVSKLMVEWDNFYRSKAVLVSFSKSPNTVYIVNKNGNKVDPPQPIEHDSFNSNPGNDIDFIDRMRKEI